MADASMDIRRNEASLSRSRGVKREVTKREKVTAVVASGVHTCKPLLPEIETTSHPRVPETRLALRDVVLYRQGS